MKLPILLALLTLPASAVVTIDWVTVGNAGNAADPATGSIYGAVAYDYKIAKNETTIAQYAEFLNSVAASDPYDLYSDAMALDANVTAISRNGSDGSYTYSVIGGGNRPITYTNWFDAARFTNWMHNGQQTGPGAALTAEDGAYTLNGATSGIINKNVGATVWIPTEDEWYKAAYYDPTKSGGSGGYWLYANQSDGLPGNTIGVAGAANFWDGDFARDQNSLPYALTDVGAFGENSRSYYGTNDQAGNAMEWNDAEYATNGRGQRGGAWGNAALSTAASVRFYDRATTGTGITGFRLASIPEPSSLVLSLLASGALLSRRSRRA